MATIDAEQNQQKVIDAIRKNGKPNAQYDQDLDIDYKTLSSVIKFGGLAAILKTMKKKKLVDFSDQGFFKDNSMITLIGDINAEAVSPQITYNQINDKVKGELTSHQKTSGW